MGTIWYLYKKSFKNRVKKALRKPITYFGLVFFLIYAIAVPFSFNILLEEFDFKSVDKLVAIFTIFVFWIIPVNFISYARRKGLLFRNSDVHFLFPTPLTPKKILLYAHLKNLLVYVVVTILVMLAAIFMFHTPLWQAILYFFVAMIMENILESSVMILLYGSEKIGEKGRKAVEAVSYILIAVFVVIAFVKYLEQGFSMEMVLDYLLCDEIQMVPVVGWYISAVHLIFMGPSLLNIVCTVLYTLFTAGMFLLAYKMECSGEYFEDAMKFAEDYQEVLKRKQDGQMARMGKKEKFGKATVSYKGGGAKALFYKQLLEYKKSRFFFFDAHTLIMLAVGVLLGYIWGQDMMVEKKEFILPVAMAYVVFCTSAVPGKWAAEMKSPYTFLIPDTPMRKLWYATVWEHIKAAICGVVIALPFGFLFQLPPLQIVLAVFLYVCLQACKLYNLVLAEVLVGDVLGKTGKQLVVLLLQGAVIGIAAAAALLGVWAGTMEMGYFLMIGVLLLLTFALMTAANMSFDKMEIVE